MPSADTIVIGAPGGLNLSALLTRLLTARSSIAGSPDHQTR